MAHRGSIFCSQLAAFGLVISAEAFDSGATRSHTLSPLPYHAHQRLIAPAENRPTNSPSDALAFTAIIHDIRARFTMAMEEARQTIPPENNRDIGALFAQNFANATGFHLIASTPDFASPADHITLARGDAAALLSLPHSAIWGYFQNHQQLPSAPHNGHFSNFTLPKDQPDDE